MGFGHFNAKSEIWGGIWAYDHKRLYSVSEIERLIIDAGFRVERTEVLTRYGIPFNHLLLVLGKRISTRLPVPTNVKSSMEKFEWDQESNSTESLPFPINIFFDFMKYVDGFNNKEFSINQPTMVISLKAIKPV